MRRCHPALLLAALLALAVPSAAANLKGVEVPDTLQADGHALTLRGLGLRKKLLSSWYVAALHTAGPVADGASAVARDEPKRLSLHFLKDTPGKELGAVLREGFFNNAQERLGRLGARLDALVGALAAGAVAGQTVAFTYQPARGVAAAVAGAEVAVIEGRDFMEALWAVWLGEVPADHGLKRALLGGR
ncbi:MAG: chalcone isomerase family protein [Deferrisomatales bacterium]